MAAADAGVRSKIGPMASWGAIALVAILAGFVVPQLFPGEPAVEKARSKTESKEKPNWDYAAPTLPDVANPQAMFIRLAAGTVFVLALCVASLWGMRRWMLAPAAGGVMSREMQLKETLQLGNRCSLHLVHLGKQQILVGVDSAGIKTIVAMDSPFADILADSTATDAVQDSAFPAPLKAA